MDCILERCKVWPERCSSEWHIWISQSIFEKRVWIPAGFLWNCNAWLLEFNQVWLAFACKSCKPVHPFSELRTAKNHWRNPYFWKLLLSMFQMSRSLLYKSSNPSNCTYISYIVHVPFFLSSIAALELRWGTLNAGRRMRKFHKESPLCCIDRQNATHLGAEWYFGDFRYSMIFSGHRPCRLQSGTSVTLTWLALLKHENNIQVKHSKTTSFADGSHHLTTQQFPKGARHASCSCLRKVFAGQSLPRESLALLQVLLLSWIKLEHCLRMVPKQRSSVYTRVSQIGQHLQKLQKCKLVRCCYQDA